MMDMKHWIRFRASALAVACAVVFSTAAMAAPKIYAPGTQGLPSSKTSKIEINQRDGMRVLSIVGEATPGIACTPLVNLQGQLFQKNGEKQEYILCPGKYRVSVYHLERINMIREYRLFGSNGQWST